LLQQPVRQVTHQTVTRLLCCGRRPLTPALRHGRAANYVITLLRVRIVFLDIKGGTRNKQTNSSGTAYCLLLWIVITYDREFY